MGQRDAEMRARVEQLVPPVRVRTVSMWADVSNFFFALLEGLSRVGHVMAGEVSGVRMPAVSSSSYSRWDEEKDLGLTPERKSEDV